MRRISFVAALAAVAAVSPLSAQTWQAVGTPNNSNAGAYWNNTSDDNAAPSSVCNAGGLLTGTHGACDRQAPVYLPLTPTPLTSSSFFLGGASGANPGGFGFNCATACSVNLLGRIAGVTSTNWGVVSSTGAVTTAAQLLSGTTVSGTFAVWISQALPTAGAGTVFTSGQSVYTAPSTFTATTNQQFAVFSAASASTSAGVFGTIINVGSGTFFVGMEDNVNGGRGFGAANPNERMSDRDYNDILVSVSAVPEPATVGLMGFGLLALAGVAKRRKA